MRSLFKSKAIKAHPSIEAYLHGALRGLVGLHDVGVAQVHAVHGLQGTPHCRRGCCRGKATTRHKLGVCCSVWLGGDEGAVVGHVDDLQGKRQDSDALFNAP